MFVVSKRNIVLPGPDGQKFRMDKEYMGPVPEWAEKSVYLKALIEDGKVIVSAGGKKKRGPKSEEPPRRSEPAEDSSKPADEEP